MVLSILRSQVAEEAGSHGVTILEPKKFTAPYRFTLAVRCLSVHELSVAAGSADGQLVEIHVDTEKVRRRCSPESKRTEG